MSPHPTGSPEFPCIRLSSLSPRPKSSSASCTTNVRSRMERGPLHRDITSSDMSTTASVVPNRLRYTALTFPRSPTCLSISPGPPWLACKSIVARYDVTRILHCLSGPWRDCNDDPMSCNFLRRPHKCEHGSHGNRESNRKWFPWSQPAHRTISGQKQFARRPHQTNPGPKYELWPSKSVLKEEK